jgi:hypothetical protein
VRCKSAGARARRPAEQADDDEQQQVEENAHCSLESISPDS